MMGLGNIDDVYKHYLVVIEENQQLKKLLNQCKYELRDRYTDVGWEDWSLITKIDEVLK